MQIFVAWLVQIRRAPSLHCRDPKVHSRTTTAVHDMSTPSPLSTPILRATPHACDSLIFSFCLLCFVSLPLFALAGCNRQAELRDHLELGESIGARLEGRACSVQHLPREGRGGHRDPIARERRQRHGVDADRAPTGGGVRGPSEALFQARDGQVGAPQQRQGASLQRRNGLPEEKVLIFFFFSPFGTLKRSEVFALMHTSKWYTREASPAFPTRACHSWCVRE